MSKKKRKDRHIPRVHADVENKPRGTAGWLLML